MLPCIYCKLPFDKFTDEHVLHDSLGGSLILKDHVCEDCNSKKFAAMDTHFVRWSLAALGKIAYDVQSKSGEPVRSRFSASIDIGGNGIPSEVFLKGKLVPEVKTQIAMRFSPDGKCDVSAQSSHENSAKTPMEVFGDFFAALDAQGIEKVKVTIDDKLPADSALVAQERDRYFYVKASDEAAGRKALSVLAEDGFRKPIETGGPWQRGSSGDKMVGVSMRMDLELTFRAAAKIVFNLAALEFGRDLVMKPELDAIRDYILTGKIPASGQPVALGGQALAAACGAREHLLSLQNIDGQLVGSVILFKNFDFVVKLGRSDALSGKDPVVIFLDPIARTNRRVDC